MALTGALGRGGTAAHLRPATPYAARGAVPPGRLSRPRLSRYRVSGPPGPPGRLRDSGIREETGCHVVAFQSPDTVTTAPPPTSVIPADEGTELILVGTTADEHRFLRRFGVARA